MLFGKANLPRALDEKDLQAQASTCMDCWEIAMQMLLRHIKLHKKMQRILMLFLWAVAPFVVAEVV
jgi:hypothetical protein